MPRISTSCLGCGKPSVTAYCADCLPPDPSRNDGPLQRGIEATEYHNARIDRHLRRVDSGKIEYGERYDREEP